MDNTKRMINSESKWRWTNEKHVHFLNSIEASFVRAMFGNEHILRLDRYLPDTSESTQDLVKERRRRYSSSDIMETSSRTDKKARRLSSESINSADDQVVPQVESMKDKEDEKDHRDVSLTPIATSH